MAGASVGIDIQYDTRQIEQALHRLAKAGQSMDMVFADIGEYLLESTKQRFADEVDSDGLPWEPLSSHTHKDRNADRILLEHGDLMDSLHYNSGADHVELGTNLIYGATHQFGDDSRNIPARPFLGISAADEDTILDLMERHLLDALATA